MLSDSFDYARRLSKTGCGNGKVLESAAFEICKSIVNGVKIIDVWNVNKFTAARTKMEVAKIQNRVAQC